MEIEVHNKKLNKILSNSNLLIKEVGLEMARKIKLRFNQLKSTNNFLEYLEIGIGKPHPLVGSLDNLYGISLNKNYRLIVEPLVDSKDVMSLRKCSKINVKGVADYHDGKCEWIIP